MLLSAFIVALPFQIPTPHSAVRLGGRLVYDQFCRQLWHSQSVLRHEHARRPQECVRGGRSCLRQRADVRRERWCQRVLRTHLQLEWSLIRVAGWQHLHQPDAPLRHQRRRWQCVWHGYGESHLHLLLALQRADVHWIRGHLEFYSPQWCEAQTALVWDAGRGKTQGQHLCASCAQCA
jgi:hypothetical protein